MNGDVHVRFCESVGVRFPHATRLPLNRLEGIFKRHDVAITVSTMCDWVGVSADLLEPLVDRMHELIRQSPVIHTDDSATSKGWRVQWELVPSG